MSAKGSELYHPTSTFSLSNCSRDRDILLAVQKYCTVKNCFRNAKPGKQVKDFYSITNDILQAEVKKDHPSDENVFTVLANMLLLLNNASIKSFDKLSVICYDTSAAMEQLEKSCHIDEKNHKVQMAEQQEALRDEMSKDKNKRIVQIIKRLIVSILILLLLGFLSGFFFPKPPVPVEESKPFYTEAYDWIRFNIFGDKKPEANVSFSEQYRPYTYFSGIAFLALICICMIARIGKTVYHRSKTIYRNRIKCNWKEFQLLKMAFTETEHHLAEMEE